MKKIFPHKFLLLLLLMIRGTVISYSQNQESIKLQRFHGYEILEKTGDESGCYFNSSKKEYLKSDSSLFYTDLSKKTAIISIHNKLLRLTSTDGKTFTDENHNYTLELDINIENNKSKSVEEAEADLYKGVLRIEDKQGHKLTQKIYGVCGY